MNRRFTVLLLLLLAFTLVAQSAPEVEITAEPHHHLVLENPYVRVFDVVVPPHQATLPHRHRHDYMFVNLGTSEISNEVVGKPPVTLNLKDGEVRYTPAPFAHTARNLGATPFHNIAIELLQDAEARKSPPPAWDEERALHILQGGTQDIMFVKDGVRVSEIDLQPGGVLPRFHHPGPHLVVAITDLNLRSDREGKNRTITPKPVQLKSGDVLWIPGDPTDSVTNVGKSPARWITLEFH